MCISAKAEMTPEEKLAARAKRWGLPHTGPPADSGDDAEKLAARAKRWGLPEPAAEDDAEKLAARAKRRGLSVAWVYSNSLYGHGFKLGCQMDQWMYILKGTVDKQLSSIRRPQTSSQINNV